jgi:hypothetical protein
MIDQRAQNARSMSTLWIAEIVPGEWGTEFVERRDKLAERTINGNRAEVRVLQDGLTAATGVTLVGNSALVLVERTRAVVVPYRR